MTSPATFLVMRHGQTEMNAAERWLGWNDSPLTPLGREQAEAAGRALTGRKIDAAVASDLGRAMGTARLALAAAGGDSSVLAAGLSPESDLRERHYGDYQGLSTPEIERLYPGSRFTEGRDTRADWRPPGQHAESLEEVGHRVTALLARLAAAHAGQTVLAVTHSGVLRVIDAAATGRTLDEIWHRTPPNGAVMEIQADNAGRLWMVKDFMTGPE